MGLQEHATSTRRGNIWHTPRTLVPSGAQRVRLPWALCVTLGAVLGVASFASPGGVAVMVLASVAAGILVRLAGSSERRFLLTLFWTGFLVRILLSVSLDAAAWIVAGGPPFGLAPQAGSEALVAYDQSRAFIGAGDSDSYSQRGYGMAQYAHGVRDAHTVSAADPRWTYGWNGYLYVVGLFYFLCGYSPVSVKFLNGLVGALLGLTIYSLAKRCFNETIARWASIGVGCFPSLIFWSTTNLKDVLYLWLTLLALLLAMRLLTAPTPGRVLRDLGLLGAVLMGQVGLSPRSAIYPILLVGCFIASRFFASSVRRRWKLGVVLVMLGGLVLAHDLLRHTLTKAFYLHLGHVHTPGVSYRYLPEQFYTGTYLSQWADQGVIDLSILSAVGRAITWYLLEPFPTRGEATLALLAYPQMLVWYLILPLALYGFWIGLKRAPLGSGVLGFSSLTWIVMAALAGGNIGTAFRSRDLVSPVLVLFASVGGWALLHERAKSAKDTADRAAHATMPATTWVEAHVA